MNARKTFLGLAGVALIAASGIFAAACGSSPNNPAPSGSSGGTGASSGGGSGTSGATTGSGSGTTSGTTASGATGASSGTTANDGGVDATMQTPTDGGDGAAPSPEAAACNPTGAIYPAGDACAPCAANPLNACSTFNVTCISFDNSVVPDAHF
jgi:hypothetical protein